VLFRSHPPISRRLARLCIRASFLGPNKTGGICRLQRETPDGAQALSTYRPVYILAASSLRVCHDARMRAINRARWRAVGMECRMGYTCQRSLMGGARRCETFVDPYLDFRARSNPEPVSNSSFENADKSGFRATSIVALVTTSVVEVRFTTSPLVGLNQIRIDNGAIRLIIIPPNG
jgi:hypothetical protein